MLARNRVAWSCNDPNDTQRAYRDVSIDLTATPLRFSTRNKLTAVGCDDVALLSKTGDDAEWSDYVSSCVGICSKPDDLGRGLCKGIGCCESSIPRGLVSIYTTMASLADHERVSNFTSCGYAFLAEENSYIFDVSDVSDSSFVSRVVETVPLVLDWAIGNQTCDHIGDTVCQAHSLCVELESTEGYRCRCLPGYGGNPYLSPGCQGTFSYFKVLVQEKKSISLYEEKY